MNNDVQLNIINKKAVLQKLSLSNSTLYLRINNGLMTPPVNLGGRRVGWPEYEVVCILKAMVAGLDEDDIKTVIKCLVEQRTQFLEVNYVQEC